jgi:hypothetical protein
MGSARAVTVADMTTLFNYELRNTHAKQWAKPETLAYINKWLEFIHAILTEQEADLVKTGSGSFDTVVGTELYDLSDNGMGDLIAPLVVWLSALGEIEQTEESNRMPHVISKEQGNTSYSQPYSYYLEGDNIGLLPFPDDIYTVNVKYIPDYTPVTTGSMPYKNIFNNVLVEGVKIIAKNREGYGTAIDAALMELFQDRAMSIIRKRQKQNFAMVPNV